MNETNAVQTATLFDVDAFLGDEISKVFAAKPTHGKDANGNTIDSGISFAVAPMKEVKKTLGLSRKDQKEELQEAVLAQQDAAFGKVKSYISGLSGDWTLTRFTAKRLSNGQNQITVVSREIPRKQVISFEKIAKAYGISVEDVEGFIKSQKDKAAKQNVDVASEVVK
jgi:hypothetical protein